MLVWIKKNYNNVPVYITENGVSDRYDRDTLNEISEYIMRERERERERERDRERERGRERERERERERLTVQINTVRSRVES